ncbi:MAG TPA: hypothetical protein VKR06_43400 [Ktedonosporobacter sp.]|nr:hypothetical protein [Ktedonosporobacter sp.]
MAQLMTLQECAKHLKIPYHRLYMYRMRLAEDIPFTRVGRGKLVDPDVVKQMLEEEGIMYKTDPRSEHLMTLRAFSRYYRIPYQTLYYYRMQLEEDVLFIQCGAFRLIDPVELKRKLDEMGVKPARPYRKRRISSEKE